MIYPQMSQILSALHDKYNRYLMRHTPPITIHTATLTLAYLHMHRAPYLRGRCLSNSHLRRLAAWLGFPNPALRSIRKQPVVAANLATLHAASLVTF